MSAIKVTIRGFYNYMDDSGDDLFSNLILPDSPLLDRNALIADILQKSDDMESLYGDPYYIQESIKFWSAKWYRTIDKWINALSMQYEPLWNKDAHEIVTDKTVTDRDTATDDKINSTRDIQNDESSKTTEKSIYSENNTISAFNSDSMRDDNSKSSTTDNTASYSANNTTGDVLSSTQKNTHAEDVTTDYKHESHSYGNVGVTSSQQLLNEELEVSRWNLYDHISDIFINDYCIMVY